MLFLFDAQCLITSLAVFFFGRIQKLELKKDKTESESQELEDLKAESLRIKYVLILFFLIRTNVMLFDGLHTTQVK